MRPHVLLFVLLTTPAMNAGCGILHAMTNDDAAEERKAQKEKDDFRAAHAASNAAILEAPCEDFPEAYRQGVCFRLPNTSGTCTQTGGESRKAMVFRMAECGHWTMLFRDVLGDSDLPGGTWLAELGTKYAVLDGLVSVLAQGGELFLPGNVWYTRGAETLVRWLADTHGAAACPRIAPYHAALGAAADWHFTEFYVTAGCTEESVARARTNLGSDDPQIRSQACTILGRFGDKSHVEKLKLLAMRDPSRDVRNACAAAANKHLLR